MTTRYRIPITAITVFGASFLLALTVGTVLYLGFGQAAESTRQLWADQSKTLIDSMEKSLEVRLRPIRAQSLWISDEIKDLSDPASFDSFMYGSLAATPQVAGIAVIRSDGISRRWHRREHTVIEENWSKLPWFEDYIQQVREAEGPGWRAPIFSDTIGATTLLHDIALYDEAGRFIGALAQIVPIRELSGFIAREHADTGITPFVLYDRDHVLAHPLISNGSFEKPLPALVEFDDLILQRIWSPDEDAGFISQALKNTEASGVLWGGDYYLFLYRINTRYGSLPWTIGAYLNTSLISSSETDRLFRALSAGLVVLLLGVIASSVVGHKVSGPVKSLVSVAKQVECGDLDNIKPLTGSHIRELDNAGNAFNSMVSGLRERQVIRDTLGRFVPEKVASSLLAGGGSIPVQETEASILFCDIESFTQLTESLGPVKIVDVLNAYFSHMVDILEQYGGVVTQFQGDAILATFNVPVVDEQHARNAIEASRQMLNRVDTTHYVDEKLNIRIGINTGPVVAGAIGAKGRLNYTVHGDAVNLAARLEALNKEYGTRLIVAESSVSSAGDSDLLEIGQTIVRGQSRSIKLYGIRSN